MIDSLSDPVPRELCELLPQILSWFFLVISGHENARSHRLFDELLPFNHVGTNVNVRKNTLRPPSSLAWNYF